MNTTTATSIFGTFVSDIGTVLSANLPTVLVVAAALIGLGIMIHYVRKWIGRR